MYRAIYLIALTVLAITPSAILAATGRIFDDTEALQADAPALAAEADLFTSIGMGIKLSLAQCDEQTTCTPNVNKDEVTQILRTLDKRINDLVGRQERKEGDFTAVITAYVDQREAFQGYRAELEKISGGAATVEDLGSDSFGDAVAAPEPVTETAASEKPAPTAAESKPAVKEPSADLDDVFSDVDEALE